MLSWLVAKSCLTPCDPMDCSPPGSSVPGVSQARILEWVAMPSFRGSFQPGSPSLADGFYTTGHQRCSVTPPDSKTLLGEHSAGSPCSRRLRRRKAALGPSLGVGLGQTWV